MIRIHSTQIACVVKVEYSSLFNFHVLIYIFEHILVMKKNDPNDRLNVSFCQMYKKVTMLTKHEFDVLDTLRKEDRALTQRELASEIGISLGTVNNTVSSLEEAGFISNGLITSKGMEALDPYRVDNAIIMAAGLSSRFAPISYEKPKGVLNVRGEILVERQIRQLKEAGIDDITIVVGYKKEYFFYLEEMFGVKIVVNPLYSQRNNNSSLMAVIDKLANTYVCSSDDYFTENPFTPYVYAAYYASVFVEGETDEWCITTGSQNRIVDVQVGGSDAWIMLGHVYFDKAFSQKFKEILKAEYELPQTYDKLWEVLYIEHIDELAMVRKEYETGVINEFDSLDELKAFDPHFMDNIDTKIFKNIATTLNCDISEIGKFYPLKQGLTNLSCHFCAGDDEYVYRHPGVGTSKLVDRESEVVALELARDLDLDTTYVYGNPKEGWKISKFIPDAKPLDVMDDNQLKVAMDMCRKLHQTEATLPRQFDFVDEGLRYENYLSELSELDIAGYAELKEKVLKLKEYVTHDGIANQCLSHNDFFALNFIIDMNNDEYPDGRLNLIDWEYAGMSDEASDFGTFVVCSELDRERADKALEYYFSRKPTPQEYRHFWAYVVFAGWCWYVWALLKEAEGERVDSWLYIYYSYAACNINWVLDLYSKEN